MSYFVDGSLCDGPQQRPCDNVSRIVRPTWNLNKCDCGRSGIGGCTHLGVQVPYRPSDCNASSGVA